MPVRIAHNGATDDEADLIMVVITTAMMRIAQAARAIPANARSVTTMRIRAFRSTRSRSFDVLLNRVIPNLLKGGV